MNNTTEVVEPGGGTVEITHAYSSKDQDRLLFLAKPFLAPTKPSDDDPSQVKGEARSLADPRIAGHLEELAPIKPLVSLSCMENGKEKNAQAQAQEPPQGPQQQSC